MTFGSDTVVRWFVDDAWEDIDTNDVMGGGRAQVSITAGRTDEARDVDPTKIQLQLRNTGGQFSPRNVTGANYGRFGRNTRLMVGITEGGTYLRYPGPDAGSEGATPAAGARVTTPDSAALSITGDLDVRLDLDLDTWRPAASTDLIGKWTATAGQKSWELVLLAGGYLALFTSADGTAEIGTSTQATVPIHKSTGRLAVRATIDVNDGGGNRVVRYYTAPTIDGTWTQLGSGLQATGTTSIFDSTTAVTIGDTATGSQANTIRGRAYAAEIRNGIAGTLVADVDFTVQTAGATSFSDGTNTWTLTGVELDDLDILGVGEVPKWPPRIDGTGTDEWVDIEAYGILRRLGQRTAPLQSTFRRGVASEPSLVAYWPLEEGSDAAFFGSAVGGTPMRWTGAVPTLSTYDGFDCSAPLPAANGAQIVGGVPSYTSTGEIQASVLARIPTGTTTGSIIMRLTTVSSRWDLSYNTGGSLTLRWYDSDGALLGTAGPVAFAVDDLNLWVSLELTQDGADVDYSMVTLEPGAPTGLASSGTATTVTLGRATAMRLNPSSVASLGSDAILGHAFVLSNVVGLFTLHDQLAAYRGEVAGRRIERLCAEAGVPFVAFGALDDTIAMGPQGQATLLTLLREAGDVDGGILHEARDALAVAYRTRESLETQQARLTLDYTAADLSLFQPDEDDRATRNALDVTRGASGLSGATGATVTAIDSTSSMSVADPPAGAGRYEAALTLNCETDELLEHLANWQLHLGTVDEPRFPAGIGVELARSRFPTAASRAAARAVRIGDLVTVENPPTSLGAPDDVRQLVQGYTHVISNHTNSVTWAVSPASPYDVAVFDTDDYGYDPRYTSDGTVTAEALDATETSIDVTTATGPVWTFADGAYDIMIGGERITVGGVTGTTANQTFTSCTRSVNGVVKAHDTGATVELAPGYLAYWSL